MQRLLTIGLTVFAIAAIATAALGGVEIPEDEDEAPTGAQAGEVTRAAAAPQLKPTGPSVVVEIEDYRYVPATVTVKPGQPVRFVNRGAIAHDVQIDAGTAPAPYSSGRLPPGHRTVYVPRGDGEREYYCTLHPTIMSGRIDVRS